jgi:molecular chaperone DnaK (HSP70)
VQVLLIFGYIPRTLDSGDLRLELVALSGTSPNVDTQETKPMENKSDCLPYSVFIKVPLSEYRLIERGSPYPVEYTFDMCTVQDGQRAIELHLLKGESAEEVGFQTLAKYVIEGLPALPRGQAKATVILTISNADEFALRVTAEQSRHVGVRTIS